MLDGGAGSKGADEVDVALADHQHSGLRVIEHVEQLIGAGSEGQRHVHRVQLRGGEVGLDVLAAV